MLSINLSGHLAVVTGGTGQLGRVMVRTMAACGAGVVIHYHRNVQMARQLLSEALDALARTARTAADGLNLRVLGWRRISLTPSGPIEPPYRARMAMAAQAEMATPVAAAGLSEVVVTVSAEALLGSGR